MQRIVFIIFFTFSLGFSQRVVGYYPYWMQNTFQPNDLDLETFTHINHSFAWPDEEGQIVAPAGMLDPSIADYIHINNRKIILSLGGWGQAQTAGFVSSTSTSELRSEFIANIIDKMIAYGYDGVDIDWEHPQSTEQKNNLSDFIEELDSTLNQFDPELLITMAVPISNWSGQWYDFSSLRPHVDFFNAMTYDIHGGWSSNAGHNSPLYQSPPGDPDGSIETGINYLLNTRGVPESKVNMGIPFWGKKYNASQINGSFNGSVTDMHYSEILPLINNGWDYQWDNNAKCPYLVKDDQSQIITYDNPLSIQRKCEFAQDRNLGGVMVWALGYDDMNTSESLTAAIHANWLHIENEKSILPTKINLNAYPNPFNPQTTINFKLPVSNKIVLDIFDMNGKLVDNVLNGYFKKGHYSLVWDPLFNRNTLSSGIYIVFLSGKGMRASNKILYVK
mgnify:FL=1